MTVTSSKKLNPNKALLKTKMATMKMRTKIVSFCFEFCRFNVYDAPLSPKFRRPSSFLRMNQGYVFPTNSLDPFLGPFSSDADATTPSYWNNFIRKAFSGQVGQERFTTAPPSRRESLGNDNLEDSRDETPMTYSVFNAPSDTGKRRGLRAKNGDEAESQKSSDLEARESLSGNDSDAHDPGYEIHEVHDLPSTSYRSSSSKGTSSFGLLLLFNSLIAAIRWLL
uniref:Uncharacterized protein n=1 Tax=Plectus sambesii TaxID=2011161 RepID=A0A914VAE2_9BILA